MIHQFVKQFLQQLAKKKPHIAHIIKNKTQTYQALFLTPTSLSLKYPLKAHCTMNCFFRLCFTLRSFPSFHKYSAFFFSHLHTPSSNNTQQSHRADSSVALGVPLFQFGDYHIHKVACAILKEEQWLHSYLGFNGDWPKLLKCEEAPQVHYNELFWILNLLGTKGNLETVVQPEAPVTEGLRWDPGAEPFCHQLHPCLCGFNEAVQNVTQDTIQPALFKLKLMIKGVDSLPFYLSCGWDKSQWRATQANASAESSPWGS